MYIDIETYKNIYISIRIHREERESYMRAKRDIQGYTKIYRICRDIQRDRKIQKCIDRYTGYGELLRGMSTEMYIERYKQI